MIVICEECGKKYRIDPARIQGKAASFKCRLCAHVIMVNKPPPPADAAGRNTDRPADEPWLTEATAQSSAGTSAAAVDRALSAYNHKTQRRFGLRARMMLLFAFIPLLLITAAGAAYLWQMETLTNDITRQSSLLVNQLAEEKIADLSRAVAVQCQLYLMAHPELDKYDFAKDMGFKTIAVQPVGKTGYTALYELPGADGVWRTWAHANPKIVGKDMFDLLKKPLGNNFNGFWKIFSGIKGKTESRGYYTWQEKDNSFRDKFMVCTPVPGTSYVVAATTYMDEFTLPMKNLEKKAAELKQKSRHAALGIVGLTMLLILLVVTLYGHRLSGRIKSLTDVAERISIGDLDIEMDSQPNDEIGELSEAIARMQESIRLSIERLRRRR
jgi:predicted Zn finger-like uncharacterized protein